MAYIDTQDIADRAKKHMKEEVSVIDISAYLLKELTLGDKDSAYMLTKAKEPSTRSAVKSAAYGYFKRNESKEKFLIHEIKPIVNSWVVEYVRERYDELQDELEMIYKDKHPVDLGAIDTTVYDDAELSDTYFRRILQKVLVKIDTSNLDKDMITSAVQTIKLLKERFDTKDEDNKIIIEIPSAFTGICPHCNREV